MNIQLSFRRRVGLVSVLLLSLTGLAHAHAKLEKSEPASGATLTVTPKHVQLWFNEALDVAVSRVELTSSAGKVELGPVHTMGDKSLMAVISGKVADGAYTVSWQTAGDDGHVVKGDYTFTLKSAH
jgi:methionine-rich copper-binding protein CopC